ncbi:hypothetical protein JRG42_21795 [Pseudomonas granadensis]|uniref:Uncharacterized protein n=1 Tax=Pseudomonas granadensis TaxID=1421430 RepID=A0ABX7GA98_9PSED|nr:hypothetical protein [Pseudomonas granadensis]MBN6775635.1 hypothetical protein [Pseudomonas granadensis]MBN6807071.1 hypothetical protein [Pseudomonas granadensis]MBN6833661.1 hypothetical protein [Pseudomonas granadensis]MBN6841317.1 hypothetical protein [Pseudomonas granadensis]MBN6869849.1 hypothetical protein [Pseudomonas granadensis]
MKAPVENHHCAMQMEKAEEPAHEMELSSPPGLTLAEDQPQQPVSAPEPPRPVPAVASRSCYERLQGAAQAERQCGATHTRPVCERGY